MLFIFLREGWTLYKGMIYINKMTRNMNAKTFKNNVFVLLTKCP